MRIVHLNTRDVSGGAARAIYRIHRGLIDLGTDSSLLVRDKTTDDPSVVGFVAPRSPGAQLKRVLRQQMINREYRRYLTGRAGSYELFSDDRSSIGSELARGLPETDILTLNWVVGFVDIESLFRGLSPTARVVWRLPDMFPFTGGCHYDAGCGRYSEGCGHCPQLAIPERQDLSRRSWLRKEQAYAHLADHQLQIVAISTSQAEQVRRSSLLSRFPLSVIPCAVEVHSFFPRPRSIARRCLNLPPDRLIVLMVAHDFRRPAKGWTMLVEALRILHSGHDLLVLTVGGGYPRFEGGCEHTHRDLVDDDDLLALIYSAADLLVFPSVQEAFGQTVLEALACGLPVVGFDTGGVRDTVHPGVTGFIAGTKTATGLADALREALADPDRLHGLAQTCRKTAVDRFSVGVIAERYRDLYERALLQSLTTDD